MGVKTIYGVKVCVQRDKWDKVYLYKEMSERKSMKREISKRSGVERD